MLETRRDIATFVDRLLAEEMPEAAQGLSQELTATNRPSNYEVVIFDRNK